MLAKDKERCYTADQLYQMYNDRTCKMYLVFLKGILKDVTRVNTFFQSDNVEQIELLEDVTDLYMSLLTKIVVPAQLQTVKRNELVNYNFKNSIMPIAAINMNMDMNSPWNVGMLKIISF